MFKVRTLYLDKTKPYIQFWQSWEQIAVLFLLGVAIGIISRLPFQSTILHHWDSVNFALALDHFDLHLHQPHPPGMFVFYILLGRLFNLFLPDANTSLVWISILATGLSVPAMFILGSNLFDRQVGLTAALFMLTSPLVWFHGEVALSYMLEFFWVLLIVLTCFLARSGDKKIFFASALLLGLAGGIRPNTPVFLFPLWLVMAGWGLWERKYSIGNIVAAFMIMGLGVLLWAVPLIVMAGGLFSYLETFQWWQAQHVEDSGSAEGIIVNVARLVMFTLYGVGIGLIPVGWALLLSLRSRRALIDKLRFDWPTQTMVAWIAPALVYFIFIHLRQAGHTFTIMPAFMLIGGLSTVLVGRSLGRYSQKGWLIITVLVVGGNSLLFLLGPASLFGSSRMIFTPPTWAAIREYDTFVTSRLEAIRAEFPPEETVVLARSRNFRLPDYYLPEFQETSLSYRLGENPIILPDHVHTLVLFDDTVFPQLSPESGIQWLSLPDGDSIRYITWNSRQRLSLNQSFFKVEERR